MKNNLAKRKAKKKKYTPQFAPLYSRVQFVCVYVVHVFLRQQEKTTVIPHDASTLFRPWHLFIYLVEIFLFVPFTHTHTQNLYKKVRGRGKRIQYNKNRKRSYIGIKRFHSKFHCLYCIWFLLLSCLLFYSIANCWPVKMDSTYKSRRWTRSSPLNDDTAAAAHFPVTKIPPSLSKIELNHNFVIGVVSHSESRPRR